MYSLSNTSSKLIATVENYQTTQTTTYSKPFESKLNSFFVSLCTVLK